jgi:hypothetical protein
MPQLFLGLGGGGRDSSVPPLTLCSICQLPSPKNSENPSVCPFSLLMLALFFSFTLCCTSSSQYLAEHLPVQILVLKSEDDEEPRYK